MNIESAYFSNKGRDKPNQDAVLPVIHAGPYWWSAIADGMGGHAGGEIASSEAIKKLLLLIESRPSLDIRKMFDGVKEHLKIISLNHPNLKNMGTTLSLIRFEEGGAEVGHVGDSRIYQMRGDGIQDRTLDQTEAQELIERGVLTKARARKYPRRHILLSVMSPEKDFEFYQNRFEIRSGDRIVLLTDGISEHILRREIRDISKKNRKPADFCRDLESEVLSRGPTDDYSVICIDIRN